MAEPRDGAGHPWRARGRPPLDLGVLQTQHREWHAHNFPNDAGKPYRALLGVGEEAGELMHAHLKWEQGIRGHTYAAYAEAAQDAIGDVIIYLANYCNAVGFNLEEVVWRTWRKVRERDWARYPNDGETN